MRLAEAGSEVLKMVTKPKRTPHSVTRDLNIKIEQQKSLIRYGGVQGGKDSGLKVGGKRARTAAGS